MSRSWHHGCGRSCPVCSPGGRGPMWHRQRATERALDEAAVDELEDLARHGEIDDGWSPCGCPDCVEFQLLDEEDAARLRAMGVLILLAPQAGCGRAHASRFDEPCETCGSYGPCFEDVGDAWSAYEEGDAAA